MIIMKKALPRRTFLRGMGVTMALPLLDAMIPAQTAWAATAANPVRRLGFVYVPMGSNINAWTPGGAGFGLPVKAGVDENRFRIQGHSDPIISQVKCVVPAFNC